ncbi:MAG: hypothetical protein LR015_03700 [Verrucomicrobia bacterium]|nr:hypothetical protein [Verrucomicrobiota bacterium]
MPNKVGVVGLTDDIVQKDEGMGGHGMRRDRGGQQRHCADGSSRVEKDWHRIKLSVRHGVTPVDSIINVGAWVGVTENQRKRLIEESPYRRKLRRTCEKSLHAGQ